MTISILLPDLRCGGAERVNLDLAREFALAGHDVRFLLMRLRGELLEDTEHHLPVVDLGAARVRQLMGPLARYLRAERPDALLAAMWPLTCVAPVIRRLSGHSCRVVVSEHNALSSQYKNWGSRHRAMMQASMRIGYRLADAVVAVSAGVADDIAQLSGLPDDRVRVVYNPVSPKPPSEEGTIKCAEALWSAPKGARVLTVGSLKAQKNQALLLRAFASVARPDARLMLVGSGTLEAELRCLAGERGVADRVIFAGFQHDLTPFYDTADLFVLSSNHEGFGNVIVEALGRGLPVVSTDCPSGPAEILENGRFGRLVPVGDEAALAKAMEQALQTAHDRDALRQRAAAFAPAIAAGQYLDLMFPDRSLACAAPVSS